MKRDSRKAPRRLTRALCDSLRLGGGADAGGWRLGGAGGARRRAEGGGRSQVSGRFKPESGSERLRKAEAVPKCNARYGTLVTSRRWHAAGFPGVLEVGEGFCVV